MRGVTAVNIDYGTVISALHRRHRATEFTKFLAKIDTEVPEDPDVHLFCDDYGTNKHPTITRRLQSHPRFHMHFTPTHSSWINQVERFCAWVTAWNEDPKPFAWTKSADQILNSLARLRRRTTGAGHQGLHPPDCLSTAVR